MATTVTSPNMSIVVPVVLTDTGPDWATGIHNALFATVDAHDHSSGKGVQITPAGLNINADLAFGSSNATTLRSVRFTNQGAPLSLGADLGCLYESTGDLYYNNASGTQIRLTASGAIASPVVRHTLQFPMTNTWLVPAGVTSIDWEIVPAGGGGGGGAGGGTGATNAATGGGGGAGGQLVRGTAAVTPGHTLTMTDGAGGTGGAGGAAGAAGTRGSPGAITKISDGATVLVQVPGCGGGMGGVVGSGNGAVGLGGVGGTQAGLTGAAGSASSWQVAQTNFSGFPSNLFPAGPGVGGSSYSLGGSATQQGTNGFDSAGYGAFTGGAQGANGTLSGSIGGTGGGGGGAGANGVGAIGGAGGNGAAGAASPGSVGGNAAGASGAGGGGGGAGGSGSPGAAGAVGGTGGSALITIIWWA